ncbi:MULTISPECIES: HlyD family efflux transporter periplasmic adaptor subunit [Asticcacaulis]|uniref:HlyD family efflux transporter periplasmic adaptor subunit n=1 Tax=Asticcacaulis TaxID=76890 RepID=UPI001AE8CEA6|nr:MULTISPECIES: HlyD family efflux transporter periplasmic adaptor subunit [Asticcacaulis]MBP2159274.1 membrane fusion protein (multidrug efflux system) [Asticcacaulis solisilvae]MDR6800319.1 membrane fusion protein (multidrug efflux system) [Asticcacaulis sp. BE141]
MADDSSPKLDKSTEQAAPPAGAPAAARKPAGNPRRRQLFLIFGGVVALAAAAFGVYHVIEGGKAVETDNAYVEASSAAVTPLVSAPVKEANINDTKVVKQGDVLVVLDDTDARLALAQAEAQLEQVRRQVQGYYSTDATLAAQTAAAQSQVVSAQAAVDQAQKAYDDRRNLAAIGAVAGEDLTNAKTTLDRAVAALNATKAQATAAQGQRATNAALISGGDVDSNPQVKLAQARVDQARLDLDRTVIRAPISGVIAKNTAEVGQRVQVGAPLMTIVPIDNAYVNANFKEVQLKKVAIGQPVELTSDLYGSSIKYHGKVSGLSGGTGSAFAIIPAQNATGNWIKVVQRLPVRIALDPKELKAHPLRVGMSMKAKIDISGTR